MKKALALLLAVVMLLGMVACNNSETETQDNTPTTPAGDNNTTPSDDSGSDSGEEYTGPTG